MGHPITAWFRHPTDEFACIVCFADGATAYSSEKRCVVVKDDQVIQDKWKEGLSPPYETINDGPPEGALDKVLEDKQAWQTWLRLIGPGADLDDGIDE